jgi:hypothetical protein
MPSALAGVKFIKRRETRAEIEARTRVPRPTLTAYRMEAWPDARLDGRSRIYPEGGDLDAVINEDGEERAAFLQVAQTATAHMAVTLTWSQTAGCDCGCSPGLIVAGAPFTGNYGEHVDLFLSFEIR